MSKENRIWLALFIVCVLSFGILGSLGSDIYQSAPPIPAKVVASDGEVVFTRSDIENGQLVWRSMGGHQTGSIWGHGSLLAPDWNADWLHREAETLLELLAQEQFAKPYIALTEQQQAGLQVTMRKLLRTNTYDAQHDSLPLIPFVRKRFASCRFITAKSLVMPLIISPLREQYGIKENAIPSAENRELMTAFFFWSTWATVTERPGESISYTNNWPYDPLVGKYPQQ